MKRKRVGNGSSKYDFDNGKSLDADVAATVQRINDFERKFLTLLKETDLSIEQMRSSMVGVMENIGFLDQQKRDSEYGKA